MTAGAGAGVGSAVSVAAGAGAAVSLAGSAAQSMHVMYKHPVTAVNVACPLEPRTIATQTEQHKAEERTRDWGWGDDRLGTALADGASVLHHSRFAACNLAAGALLGGQRSCNIEAASGGAGEQSREGGLGVSVVGAEVGELAEGDSIVLLPLGSAGAVLVHHALN